MRLCKHQLTNLPGVKTHKRNAQVIVVGAAISHSAMELLQNSLPDMQFIAGETLHHAPAQINHRFINVAVVTKMAKLHELLSVSRKKVR